MQIKLTDIQEHHEIDDASFHGEHVRRLDRVTRSFREANSMTGNTGTPPQSAAFQRGLGSQKSRPKTDDRTDPLNRSFGKRHRAENPPGARAALHSRHRHPRIVCCGEHRRRQVDRLQRAAHPSPSPSSCDSPFARRGSLRLCSVACELATKGPSTCVRRRSQASDTRLRGEFIRYPPFA